MPRHLHEVKWVGNIDASNLVPNKTDTIVNDPSQKRLSEMIELCTYILKDLNKFQDDIAWDLAEISIDLEREGTAIQNKLSKMKTYIDKNLARTFVNISAFN